MKPIESKLHVLTGPSELFFVVFISLGVEAEIGLPPCDYCILDKSFSVSKSLKRPPAIVYGDIAAFYFIKASSKRGTRSLLRLFGVFNCKDL